jgi:YD repeat-containing protein
MTRYSYHVALLALLVLARSVSAQTPQQRILDSKGLHADRSYFSPEPFEHLDTLSGNLILTFTDLTLPGNAGRSLTFVRTYNSGVARVSTQEKTSSWAFGISGMVMRIKEARSLSDGSTWPAFPPTDWSFQPSSEETALQRILSTTPKLVTADGGEHDTMYDVPPNASASTRFTLVWVRTAGFLRYDRETRTLYMPDGTVCTYDTQGRLSDYVDPFGNRVELEWTSAQPPQLIVHQHLGTEQAPQERVVTITLDSETQQPTRMEFGGRIWQYELRDFAPHPYKQLAVVRPPEGRPWEFTYQFNGWPLTGLTTPNRGTITYTYDFFPYPTECPATTNGDQSALVERLSGGPPGTTGGTWTIQPIRLGTCDLILRMRIITTPSQTRVTYVYDNAAEGMDSGREVVAGAYSLSLRQVALGTTVLESETRSYQEILVADHSQMTPYPALWRTWGSYEVKDRRITRNDQTHTTTFTYRGTNFGDFHNPETIVETGSAGVSRTTTRTYRHPSPTITTRFLVALPETEEIRVGSEVFKKSWNHNNSNGFLDSQTIFGITTTFTPTDESPRTLGNVGSNKRGSSPATSFKYTWGVVEEIGTPEYIVTREIDSDGTIRSETRGGRKTTFEFDDLFRVKKVQPPGSRNAVTTTYDNDDGQLLSTIVSRGPTPGGTASMKTTFDGFGRPIRTENSLTIKTRTAYDAEGRTTYASHPFTGDFGGPTDIGVLTGYDGLSRVTSRTNPDGSGATFSYGQNRVTITEAIASGRNRQTVHTFRTFGNPDEILLASVTDAANSVWQYGYNGLGRLTSVTAPGNISRSWTYDQLGDGSFTDRVETETQPEWGPDGDPGTSTYAYHDTGMLRRKDDAEGQAFIYNYDGNDRLKTITLGEQGPILTDITYETGTDNRQTMTSDGAATVFTYEPLTGRLASRRDTVDGAAYLTQFAYDSNDNLALITYPSGRNIAYAHDSEGRVTRVFDGALTTRVYASDVSYHPFGAVRQFTAGNGIVHQFAYDSARLWPTAVTAGQLQLVYENYDLLGNVGTIREPNRPERLQNFTYDDLDRLRTAGGPSLPLLDYRYDEHGNRVTTPGGTVYDYYNGKLRLWHQDERTFTYDRNGNVETETSPLRQYTYTPFNMIASVSGAGAGSHAYDADNWRVRKTVGANTTIYIPGVNNEVLSEWTNPGSSPRRLRDYIYLAGRLIAQVVESPQ